MVAHVLAARSRRFLGPEGPELPNVFERTTVPRMVRRMHGEHVADLVDQSAERFWFNTESLRAVVEDEASPLPSRRDRSVVVEAVLPGPDTPLPDSRDSGLRSSVSASTRSARAASVASSSRVLTS